MVTRVEFIGKIEDDFQLKQEKQIVIYGCGKVGGTVYSFLEANGMSDKVVAFCDKNEALQGKLFREKPVCSIEACVKEYPAATYLIACADVLNVLQLMQKKQIDKIHIIA